MPFPSTSELYPTRTLYNAGELGLIPNQEDLISFLIRYDSYVRTERLRNVRSRKSRRRRGFIGVMLAIEVGQSSDCQAITLVSPLLRADHRRIYQSKQPKVFRDSDEIFRFLRHGFVNCAIKETAIDAHQ